MIIRIKGKNKNLRKTDDKYDNLQNKTNNFQLKLTHSHIMYLKEKQEPKVIVQEKYYEQSQEKTLKMQHLQIQRRTVKLSLTRCKSIYSTGLYFSD